MTHFLARLVERARGSLPRVQPLIAPRFAPAPFTEITTEIEASEPSSIRSAAPAMNSEAPPREIADQKEARLPASTEAEKTKPPRESVSQKEARLPASTEAEKTKAPLRIEHEKLLVPSQYEETASPPVDRQSFFGVPDRWPNRNGATPTAGHPARRNRLSVDRLAAIQPTERLSRLPNESRSEPPIVRVTIGRIEVHAAPAPVRPPKPVPHSEPKLTLDAYLKARKEGTR